MKASLLVLLIFTVFVAGITIAFKSALSLQFIKPGTGIFLQSFGPTGSSSSSGQGIWRYATSSNTWQQEKQATGGSFTTSQVFEFLHDPGSPENIYAATSTGLYRYEGSKDSWTYLAGGIPSNAEFLSVSVNAKNPSHVFISTLQSDGTSALWRSQDSGKTFMQVYASSSQTEKIVDVADDWYNPQRVFALIDQGKFLRSDDEGLSWRVVKNLNYTGFTHLIMDPNDSRILYVLTPAVGMLQSTNSGDTWESGEHAFAGLPVSAKTINDLRGVQGISGRLYYATNYGILRSENGGKSFTVVHSLVTENSTPIQVIDAGKDNQTLFMAAGNNLYESHDAGKSWETHSISSTPTIHTLIYLSSEKIFAGF